MLGIETIAIIFSLLYVILAAKEHISCWTAAIVSVSLYIYICYEARLYSETGLQIFYLFMAFYGWWNWSKKSNSPVLNITEWGLTKHLLIIIVGVISTFFMGFYFTIYTDASMPILDAFTTIFSIAATYMMVKKVLGNWLYWIVIDITSIHLYQERALEKTAILFMLYTAMAIFGYFSWAKQIKKNA